MKERCLYILFMMPFILGACDKPALDMPDSKLSLDAVVQEMVQYKTRAVSGVDIYAGTSVAGMQSAVWLSEHDGVYPPSNPVSPTFLPYRANLTYEEGSTIVYTNTDAMQDPVSYVVEGDKRVYCVGLYPQEGWTTNNDYKIATHVVDGKQDLMFATQESGSLLEKMGRQTYRHLLSWVRFTVRATDPDVATDWGRVTSVQMLDARGYVNITLGTGDIQYSSLSENVDVLDSPLDLTVAIQDIGSALCIPSTAGYKLKIVTNKGEEKILSLDTDFKAGELYLVNLYFNPRNDINAVCSLVPWNEDNVVL